MDTFATNRPSLDDPWPLTAELLAEHGGTLPDGTVVMDDMGRLRTVNDDALTDGEDDTGKLADAVGWGWVVVAAPAVHVPADSRVGT